MKMTITGRKVTLRPSFEKRTEEKFQKLDKFFPDDASCVVTVSPEQHAQRVEATVRSNGMLYRAEVAAEEANDAVDRLIDMLIRQIRKNKTRLEKRLRENAFDPIQPNEQEETEFEIVRSKNFPIKPLDVEEAILQMNMLGHQFFMFRNMDSGEINVVYRRHGGGYGLLEPDAE